MPVTRQDAFEAPPVTTTSVPLRFLTILAGDVLPPRRRRLAEWAESSFQVQHGKRESFAAGGGAEARPAGAVSTSGNGGHPHGVATYGPGDRPDGDRTRRATEDERPVGHRVITIRA